MNDYQLVRLPSDNIMKFLSKIKSAFNIRGRKNSDLPGLRALPKVSSYNYMYDPRIWYVAADIGDNKVHLGYYVSTLKKEMHVHCKKKAPGNKPFLELKGKDAQDINCTRCSKRISALMNSRSEICKAIENQKRYYYGKYAIASEVDSKKNITHLIIIPKGSSLINADLDAFCGCLTPKLSYSNLESFDTSRVTCRFCKENFSKLPLRDENGKPIGKADLWFMMGTDGHSDVKPTLVKKANFSMDDQVSRDDDEILEIEADSGDDENDDDEGFISITKYKK